MNPLVLAQLTNMIGPLLGMVAQQAAARPSPEPQDQAPRIDAATISALSALVAAASQRQEPQPAPKMPLMSAFVSVVILISAIATMVGIAWLIIISKADSPLAPGALRRLRCTAFQALHRRRLLVRLELGIQGKGRGERRRRDCRGPAPDDPGTAGATRSTRADAARARDRRSPRRSPSPSTASAGPPARAQLACALTCPATASRRRSATIIRALNIRASALLLFGQLGYGIIGGGHKIARFPHPVNGAAANFDLLRRNYVGMTIGAAGAKWTGDNGFGIPGYDPNVILTTQMLDDPAQAIAIMKAIAKREAGRESPLTGGEWNEAGRMFHDGSADAWISGLTAPAAKPLDLAASIVAAMRRKGYVIDINPGEVNIVYVEGLNEDGTVNDDEQTNGMIFVWSWGLTDRLLWSLANGRPLLNQGAITQTPPSTRPEPRGSSSDSTRLGA